MQQFELPNGRMIEADPANPEHAQWLQANGAKPAQVAPPQAQPPKSWAEGMTRAQGEQVIKPIASGLVEGAARLPFAISDTLNFGLDAAQAKLNPEWMRSEGYQNFRKNHKGSGWLDAGLGAMGTGFYQPKPGMETYLNIGGQATGGALVNPAMTMFRNPQAAKAGLGPALASANAGALGGEAVAQGLADEGEAPNPLIKLLAGLGIGGGVGIATGRTGAAQRALHDASQGLGPDDFAAASKNIDKFGQTGAKTGTLGEAFEKDNALLGLTGETVSKVGGTELSRRLTERPTDLKNLRDEAISRTGGASSTANTSQRAAEAANNRLRQLREARTRQYTATISQAQPLPPQAVGQLHSLLVQEAGRVQSKVEKDALEAVADALLQANKATVTVPGKPTIGSVGKAGFKVAQTTPATTSQVPQFKTDIRAAAKDLKQLQDDLEFNDFTASGGTKLNAHAVKQAYKIVDGFLKTLSPEFKKADENYAKITRRLIAPTEAGAVGAVAGRNFEGNKPVPTARLEAIAKGQDPQDAAAALNSLAKGASDGPQLKKDVVGTLLRQRDPKGSGLPSTLMRGLAGSDLDNQNQALMKAAGLNPKFVNDPLDVVDLLDPRRTAGQVKQTGNEVRQEAMRTNVPSAMAAPFQSAARFFRTRAQDKRYHEVAELLGNPTQENLRKLELISKQHPDIKRDLTISGVFAGANTIGGE